MSDSNRLKTYAALAAAPCAALGGIAVEAHAAPGGNVPVTAQLTGGNSFVSANAFTAASLQFQAFVWCSNSGTGSSGGLQLLNADRSGSGPAGQMRFFGAEFASQVISWSAAGRDKSNTGYGGRANFGGSTSSSSSSPATFIMGTGVSGAGNYMGFAVENTNTGTYVAGWVKMAFDWSDRSSAFVTIQDWAFNTGDSTTSITMPGTQPSGAVPGVGGLAGLAMGAAGLRRKRQRVA